MAYDIIKPTSDDQQKIIKWWNIDSLNEAKYP